MYISLWKYILHTPVPADISYIWYWELGDTNYTISNQATNLEIHKIIQTHKTKNGDKIISLLVASGTIFSLMKTGVHRTNGLNRTFYSLMKTGVHGAYELYWKFCSIMKTDVHGPHWLNPIIYPLIQTGVYRAYRLNQTFYSLTKKGVHWMYILNRTI